MVEVDTPSSGAQVKCFQKSGMSCLMASVWNPARETELCKYLQACTIPLVEVKPKPSLVANFD